MPVQLHLWRFLGGCCNRLQDFVEAIGSTLTTTVRNVRNRSQKLFSKDRNASLSTKGKPHGFS